MKKLRLEVFLRFTSKQTYRNILFLYILFAIHHSLRCCYLLFKLKSGSGKISILLFSRIFVHRCHGNIDFHKYDTQIGYACGANDSAALDNLTRKHVNT